DHHIRKCIIVKHLHQSSLKNGVNGHRNSRQENDSIKLSNGVPETNCNGHSENSTAASRFHADFSMNFDDEIDVWYHQIMANSPKICDVEWMDAEDPLFMLYTSGSTGKPKGVVHTQAGYMLYTYATFFYVFDYQDDDIYFCTADIGWITGHSYVTYGPLLNGATSIIFEGIPFYPDFGRFWSIVDKYRVTKFYTAPTAIRALMKEDNGFVTRYNRSSLKILGTVGEPINPAAWLWYYKVVGSEKCPIVDTYWQTETAFKGPWPGIMRTVYGDHERFEQTYFSKYPGYYCTADGCRRDADGYYWITGRVDDMMNVSGHLLSTAEIESAVVSHGCVAEAAIVPHPHEIKGTVPYCFVTLVNGTILTPELIDELKLTVRRKIGPVAVPAAFQNAPGLPKTRSGKIMRRILRKVASGAPGELGDLSTLADENVINDLLTAREDVKFY
uniref:acetate--CoA ligase n=1 Tax=Romanomermis culicivorax TaxID=13658 RepID=A0A915I9K9_ROMCU